MPAQLTTRAQVNGYRFLLQRFEHALVRRDVRMLHDPMRIQFRSLITGLVLAVLATGGCAVLAYLHPQGQVGDAKIVMGADSGALYAVVDKTLHPVLNLASARLITGSSESPTSVEDAKLTASPRGPLLGIPGAPAALPGPAQSGESAWTLCDDVTSGLKTTVLDGIPELAPQIHAAGTGDALLVAKDDATYLVYDGKHARIDMGSAPIVSALEIQAMRPRQIGIGLLNATVAAPDLAVPLIPNLGAPSAVRGGGIAVGSVVRIEGLSAQTPFVVLADGLQKISEFTAQVLRSANSMGLTAIPVLSPDAIMGVPMVHTLPVDEFPVGHPAIVMPDVGPVACAAWARNGHDQVARLRLLIGMRLPLATGVQPMTLVASTAAASAYIPAATGEFVQVTGVEPDSTRRDGLWYVTDTGVRFGIPDAATAAMLGLTEPKLAPWQIVGQLPSGPMLDRSSALIARDVVHADGGGQ
ncbi:type VII secretion protein EccB [Nocardia sp. SYP-A9097]|uniref:type VII secretion protein EccB n=1 Tax=Nocardia sp. SYP-A9097 TaxID=2663237 RepID=UPI00132485C7|nr:type VII secretion protein EccB [Nocardia sp. SYP-A9097]MRH89365.1 type VII secretion protein EccB [Nocardia sp. SYP-A9097]